MGIAFADIYQMDPSWLYPGHAFHTKAGGEKFNQANLKLGKELLAKSSYKGEKLTFIVDNIRPNTDTATIVQQRLKDIGINVEVSVADWPTVSKVGLTPHGLEFLGARIWHRTLRGPCLGHGSMGRRSVARRRERLRRSTSSRPPSRSSWMRESARASSTSSRSMCMTTRW